MKKQYIVGLGLLVCSSCVDSSTEQNTRQHHLSQTKHPLDAVQLIDGKVPGIDIHKSARGYKYAYGETTTGLQDGKLEHFSGVVELPVSKIDYQDSTNIKKERVFVPVQPKPIIHPHLQNDLLSIPINETIPVRIGFRGGETEEHLFIKKNRDRALGLIGTKAETENRRLFHLSNKAQNIETSSAQIKTYLENKGIQYKLSKVSYFILTELNRAEIEDVAKMRSVKSINSNVVGRSEYSSGDLDLPFSILRLTIGGTEVLQGTQASQYTLATFDGRYTWHTRMKAAVIDDGVPFRNHVAFKDSTYGGTRVTSTYVCSLTSCGTTTSHQSQHATRVAQVLGADLNDFQDPTKTLDVDQYPYSGIAPETYMRGYALNYGSFSFDNAIEHIINSSDPVDVVNLSFGFYDYNNWFHDCNGDFDEDELVNDLFESGTLLVKSAGNIELEDYPLTNQCAVSVPGSAIGAFTVGGTGVNADEGVYHVNYGPLSQRTPTGGLTGQRTIIDLVTTARRNNWISHTNSTGYVDVVRDGTSYSAPVVTGAAINLLDFYRRTYGSYLDTPGALFTNLLVMGDRNANSLPSTGNEYVNYRPNSRFTPRWGGGRLKMRLPNHPGMDYPWNYVRYSVCVDHGERVKFHFGPNAPTGSYSMSEIPGDVEHLKATIYWYDRRLEDHGNASLIDDIDLRIVGYNNFSGNIVGPYTFQNSNSSYDNKEMVYLNFADNPTIDKSEGITVEVRGYDVTADNEGCGTNSMRVWVVIYYEDGDRDDADGPSSQIESL